MTFFSKRICYFTVISIVLSGMGGIFADDSSNNNIAPIVEKSKKSTDSTVTSAQQEVLAEQLRSLLAPSSVGKREKIKRVPSKPNYKIIPGVDGLSTLVYYCRYVEVNKDLVYTLESAVSVHGIVERSAEQNVIVIHDQTNKMTELANIMMAMDVEAPQVLVEAKVVEVNISDGMQRNFDINFKGSHGSAGTDTSIQGQAKTDKGLNADWFPYVSGNKNFEVSLQWLIHGQRAKILSAPNVIVSRNSPATITTGQEVPIQSSSTVASSTNISTTFKQVGVILEIIPKFINHDSVTLTVTPEVSNISSYTKITSGDTSYDAPHVAIRKVESTLTLLDGQVIMLGGLYSDKETVDEERTPFLSDIPYIGEFFTAKNHGRELVQLIFFLRVTILSPDDIASSVIYDPGAQATEIRKIGVSVQESKEIFPKDQDGNKTTLELIEKEFLKRETLNKD
ncbi:MAG: hypothetical protein PHE87_01050 [Victivallaceae bacterium]|nr:hypothetical protein [Victivallaceae bacterium]